MKKLFILLFLFILPAGLNAQTVIFVPEKEIIDQNEISSFDIRIDSNGYFINVIELYISYSGSLEILDISTNDSFVDLWVSKPSIDESKKEIVFIGGLTNGTTMNDGLLARVLVRGNIAGDNRITLDQEQSRVYLDDGLGTQKVFSSLGVTISVSKNQYIPTIEIFSVSHPKENEWYSNSILNVAWSGLLGDIFSYELSHELTATLDDAPEGSESTKRYLNLDDGEYIFSIKKQITTSTWSDVSRRRFRIDATVPDINNPTILEDNVLFNKKSILIFDVQDSTSGIFRVSVIEGKTRFENIVSPYTLKTNSDTVTIIAEDNAGNKRVVELTRNTTRNLLMVWYAIGLIIAILALLIVCSFRRRGKLSIHDTHTND